MVDIYNRYLIGILLVPPHGFGIPEVYDKDLSGLFWILEVMHDHNADINVFTVGRSLSWSLVEIS